MSTWTVSSTRLKSVIVSTLVEAFSAVLMISSLDVPVEKNEAVPPVIVPEFLYGERFGGKAVPDAVFVGVHGPGVDEARGRGRRGAGGKEVDCGTGRPFVCDQPVIHEPLLVSVQHHGVTAIECANLAGGLHRDAVCAAGLKAEKNRKSIRRHRSGDDNLMAAAAT
ncbi:hypothetical protein [Mesorhizobium sp. IMUNJ 23232]|uniref:hypothetical protein n=1 Tax=Mesorhizobium sp. IMUNJ 23232 TaxID=3376064 RepID=UPI0037AD8672